MGYERKGTFPLDQIFDLIPSLIGRTKKYEKKRLIDGDMVNVYSTRLKVFKYKGHDCVDCGVMGAFFAKERSKRKNPHPTIGEPYHLNLYAINEQGHEVLMTRDHIVPLSKGGADTFKNQQPMCTKCNSKKGNTYEAPPNVVVPHISKKERRAQKKQRQQELILMDHSEHEHLRVEYEPA